MTLIVPGLTLEDLRDDRGAFRVKSLFREGQYFQLKCQKEPIYTMYDEDVDGYISVKRVLMESVDEYDAAMKLVGSMAHWRKLCKSRWFMYGDSRYSYEGLAHWREDKKNQQLSQARAVLVAKAEKGDVTAAKKLYDEAYKAIKDPAGKNIMKDSIKTPTTKDPRGRPKKEQPETKQPAKILSLEERLEELYSKSDS